MYIPLGATFQPSILSKDCLGISEPPHTPPHTHRHREILLSSEKPLSAVSHQPGGTLMKLDFSVRCGRAGHFLDKRVISAGRCLKLHLEFLANIPTA